MSFSLPEQAEAVLAGAGVAVAYLFGSRASGTERPDSDVDLAILADRDIGLLEEQKIADRLRRALGVTEVDLVVLDRASLELRGHVVQTGKPIYVADESRRVEFEVRTRSQYLDYLPTLREHTRRFLAQVAEHGLSHG